MYLFQSGGFSNTVQRDNLNFFYFNTPPLLLKIRKLYDENSNLWKLNVFIQNLKKSE